MENWCYGFDELKERAAQYPLDKVEEITWVPAETIAAAARAVATNHPSSFMWGLAIDTNSNGVQAGHCVLILAAILGDLDVPGGVTLAVPASFMGKWRYECAQQLPPGMMEKQITDLEHYRGFQAAHVIAHPDCILDTLETKKPYPLKMAWFYATNGVANTTNAQGKRWYKGLMELEFNVCQDVFMTPTAMGLCDLFLPVTTFAEHDGMVLPHFGRNTHMVMAMNKAVEVGDCHSDLEIDFMVGKRLNPKAWPWDNVADFFTEQLHNGGVDMTFEQLQEDGWLQMPFEYRKYEKGLLRSDGEPGFNTPTGLVELCSSLYEDWGEDPPALLRGKRHDPLQPARLGRRVPPGHDHRRPRDHVVPLRASPSAVAASHHAQPARADQPRTAAKYGIEDGDWVCIENPLGKAIEKAQVTPIVDPRVIHAQHGWWYPEQDPEAPNLSGVWKSNINSLIPHRAIGRIGFGAPFKNVMCKIYKVDGLDALGTLDPDTEEGAIGKDSPATWPPTARSLTPPAGTSRKEACAMSDYALLIDYKYCTGCHVCEVSCRKEHDIPLDEWGIKLNEMGPVKMRGEWLWDYVPVPSDLCDLCEERVSQARSRPACTTASRSAWSWCPWRSCRPPWPPTARR